jgi:cell division protein FtsW (lipid II flippase)
MSTKDHQALGRLTATYVIGAAYVQRAVFTAVLTFMFFLAMIFAAYIRPHILYFFLATAFLIVYLITMFSFVMQRKANVEVYENGLKYRKNVVLWSEINDVSDKGEVSIDKKRIALPQTISDLAGLVANIRRNVSKL